MSEQWDDHEFEDIAGLIRDEKKQALEIFRQRHFEQTIRARVRELPEKRDVGFFSRRTVVPAAAAALLLIIAGAIFLFWPRPAPDIEKKAHRFTAVLGGLPGLSEWAARQGHPSPEDTHNFGVTQSIRDVLASTGLEKAKAMKNASLPSTTSNVPRLDLQRKMAILFKERVIERVLVSLQKKSEEV